MAIAAEAERERLLELVTVLNRRLDKERNDANNLIVSIFYYKTLIFLKIKER